jgi:hypothetical protein
VTEQRSHAKTVEFQDYIWVSAFGLSTNQTNDKERWFDWKPIIKSYQD